MSVDLEIVDRIIELTKQYRDLPAHDELRKPLREAIESLIYPQIIYTGPPAGVVDLLAEIGAAQDVRLAAQLTAEAAVSAPPVACAHTPAPESGSTTSDR